MYEKNLGKLIEEILIADSVGYSVRDVFWVNNSAIPVGPTYRQLAEGLSNEKVCFGGVVKTGIAELMAVHHRQSQSPHKLTSAMIAIGTSSVIRRQAPFEDYDRGVSTLMRTVVQTFLRLK